MEVPTAMGTVLLTGCSASKVQLIIRTGSFYLIDLTHTNHSKEL